MARPAANTAGHIRSPQRRIAATANPLGSRSSGRRLPRSGNKNPANPLAKIAIKVRTHRLTGRGERTTRRSSITWLRWNPSQTSHGNPQWNVIQSSRVTPALASLLPELLREPATRWFERVCANEPLLIAYRSLPEHRQAQILRLAAASEFAASALIRDADALGWLAGNMTPELARAANDAYERRAAAAAVPEAQRILREWRRRAMLRIAWRDLAGEASVPE